MKPIKFNTDMVRAILNGKKTVTRRVVKPQPTNPRWNQIGWVGWDDGHGYKMFQPYQLGDILYVQETWQKVYDMEYINGVEGEQESIQNIITNWDSIEKVDAGTAPNKKYYIFKADNPEFVQKFPWQQGLRWKPSIHMPEEAARIFLRVTNVRVEKLRSITLEHCVAEGAVKRPRYIKWGGEKCLALYGRYKKEFSVLWDSIIKKTDIINYGWNANPWVWVVEFERISKEEANEQS